MKLVFSLFTITCCVIYLEALDCGVEQKNGEMIRQALGMCVKNNETLQKILEMNSASEEQSDSNSSEEENQPKPTTLKSNSSSRNKRATMRDRSLVSESSTSVSETTNGNHVSKEESSIAVDTSENCIIQCVLNHMGLIDANGLPEHSKLVEGLLKDVNQRELRNFLQDTVDECYQDLNEDDEKDQCSYANKLVKCLADKGRSNCTDWPAGSLPF